jgi:hypothetical protein
MGYELDDVAGEDFQQQTLTGDTSNPTPEDIQAAKRVTADFFSYAYQGATQAQEIPVNGQKSMFNEYSVFYHVSAGSDAQALYDWGTSKVQSDESRNPTFANIIAWSKENPRDGGGMAHVPYAWADFLYCKYAGLIPNNYMVTLRRYPIPMLDNLKTHDGRRIPPLAQAVTWMGEETGNKMSEIMSMSFGQVWNEIEASVQEVTGNEVGFDSSPLAGSIGGNVLAGIEGFLNPNDYSGLSQAQTDYAQKAWGSEGPYANKVYGPVNVINKTMVRGRGLNFEQEFKIKFHYTLRSIGGVNPKMAMLDLLSNLTTLTYNNAKFWGGAIRYFPQKPQVAFFGNQNDFYSGDVDKYIDSVVGEFGKIRGTLLDSLAKLVQDPISALKELAKGGLKFEAGKIAAKNRPAILAMRSLLTGLPVGEWHMVVGNPMNPIMCIGNLVCTDTQISTSDTLGPDDFPDEMYFTITLKHGKPRDAGDIQSMFNLGNGRLYYGINDNQTFSSTANTNADTAVSVDAAQHRAQQSNAGNLRPSGGGVKTMYGYTDTELKIGRDWSGPAPIETKK